MLLKMQNPRKFSAFTMKMDFPFEHGKVRIFSVRGEMFGVIGMSPAFKINQTIVSSETTHSGIWSRR